MKLQFKTSGPSSRRSTGVRRGLLLLAGALALAGLLGSCSSSPTSERAPGSTTAPPNPNTVTGLALITVGLMGMQPPHLEPTAFELRLLAEKPLTYATYLEALHALATCVADRYPGGVVKFSPDPYFSYLLAFAVGGGPPPGPSGGFTPVNYVAAKCDSQYAAQVQAAWTLQNQLSGSSLIAEQGPFLHCVISAGVKISSNASLDQIHSFFDTRGWGDQLAASQQAKADKCVTEYANFLTSL